MQKVPEYIFSGYLSSGDHTLETDIHYLPAVMYYAVLDHGGTRETVKVVVGK